LIPLHMFKSISFLVFESLHLFLLGILAGCLFLIHYGMRIPISTLVDGPQIQLRQSLIRRLRVMIPLIFLPSLVFGIAAMALDSSVSTSSGAFIVRLIGVLVLFLSLLLSVVGTAPVNKATLSWQANNPPANWQEQLKRWEKFDVARTWAAGTAFALVITAMALDYNS